jgi:glycosyltransferase involved in cell wall biosynthesis
MERSVRSLRRAGVEEVDRAHSAESLARRLALAQGPLVLLQAGGWLLRSLNEPIPPSATGLPLVGYGRTHGDSEWRSVGEAGTGRVLRWPPVRCVYVEAESAWRLGALLLENGWPGALESLADGRGVRWVSLGCLANQYDPHLRVMQLVTSIQVGGAERVALDVAEGLNRVGERAWVGVTGRSLRKPFMAPRGLVELHSRRPGPGGLADAVASVVDALHLDLVHAHLLSGPECAALAGRAIPLVTTLHNLSHAWPEGVNREGCFGDLLVACAKRVEAEAHAAGLPGPCRTAWNGISEARMQVSHAALEKGRAWRCARGWGAGDLVLVSVANPRAQKRLDRVPGIVAALQKRLPERRVRWIWAGEAALASAGAQAAQQSLYEAVAEHGIQESLAQVSGSEVVAEVLWASDVFLSTSAFEGLSLSHLEALAAGLPVVATDVGGASEIAGEMRSHEAFYRRVDPEASVDAFVEAILQAPARATQSVLPSVFERGQMVSRYLDLYRHTLLKRLRQTARQRGIWFVTNNFSTGGAQTSARRLMQALLRRGVPVRAWTLEEDFPTRGAIDLSAKGVEVVRLPASCRSSPKEAAFWLGAVAAAEPPEAVYFWNALAAHKLHMADHLFGVRIIDVSPGEMFFHALERFFAVGGSSLPYRNGSEYGARLGAAVVKYARERAWARRVLECSVEVIPNGVPDFEEVARPGGVLRLGTACRISPQKRLEELLEALHRIHAQMPAYEFHIAGREESGAQEYAERMRRMADGLPVVWRGELDGTEAFLREIHLFVMISEPEGCPNASLEAMAAGLPVVATDAGGAHEQVVDGVTGRLTPRGDTAALGEAVLELSWDEPMRERLGRAGRDRARERFSLERMADAYRDLAQGGR